MFPVRDFSFEEPSIYLFIYLSLQLIAKTNLASPRESRSLCRFSSKMLLHTFRFIARSISLSSSWSWNGEGKRNGTRRTKVGGRRGGEQSGEKKTKDRNDCSLDPWKPRWLAALSFPCFPTIVSIPCIGKMSALFQASPFFFFWSIRILPSFLLSFSPFLSFRGDTEKYGRWKEREGGTLILEGGVIETQKSAPLSK